MSFADRPLVLFAAYFAAGALVMIAIVWFDAAGAITLPRWFPQEGIAFTLVCAVVAAAAAWGVHLRSWGDVVLATLIATAIHIAVYLLPLAFLLSAPISMVLCGSGIALTLR